ncbi:MAG: phosphate ABC transporter permease subunit PstC [Armatimonadota bacterium]|nr:phosphate ABC transporter permease subunit PstC [Armatimonadota bacterium]
MASTPTTNTQGIVFKNLSRYEKRSRVKDIVASIVVHTSGIAAIVVLFFIFVFLAKDALPTFTKVGILKFLIGTSWQPEFEKFGILPLLVGSLFVTFGALVVAVPIGIACAVYIAEVSPPSFRSLLKVIVELLAGIPSVVFGFIGLMILAPLVQKVFELPTGLTALTGAVTLAFMSMPTIISVSEDAITAVPKSYSDGSLALGATKWETIRHVVIPSAKSGIVAACLLGMGRAIGETMAVLMVTGNASILPKGLVGLPNFFLGPVRTMTATIASDMGETVQGSTHYNALFAIGLTLFAISFAVNMAADLILRRGGLGKE